MWTLDDLRQVTLPVAMAVLVALAGPGSARADTVRIDTGPRHQTLTGWEVTARFWEFDKDADRFDGSWRPLAGPLIDRLVEDGGINRVRIEIASGFENPIDYWARFTSGEIGYESYKAHFFESINDDDDARSAAPGGFQFAAFDEKVETVLLPMRARLATRGERLFVTVTFVDFRWTRLKGDFAHALEPEEYAEFVSVYFLRLREKYGVVPDALEIILEPDNTDHWGGAQIGRAADAVAARLASHGFAPNLIAPSTSRSRIALRYYREARAAMRGPGRIGTLSYHKYDGRRRAPLKRIAEVGAADGVATAMLELTSAGIDSLFDDLLLANASAWQQYGIARKIVDGKPRASNSYFLEAVFGDGTPRIRLAPRSRLLAPVFRAFRAGSVRVGTTSDADWLRAVAVLRPEGGLAVALRSRRAGRAEVVGLAPGPYDVAYHSGGGDGADATFAVEADAAGRLALDLPGSGVAILRRRPES